jgi:hypothetical protein
MEPAANGRVLTVTAYGVEAWPAPQALVPSTIITPLVADAEKSTVMLLVLAPVAIVAPEGKLQL